MIRRKEELERFLNNTEFAGAELRPLAGDASARRYVRVVLGGKQAMVMDTPAEGENFPAFVAIAEYLCANGYSAPNILARDMQSGFLLLEDFGDESFTRILGEQNDEIENTVYSAAIELLAKWRNSENQNLLQLPLYDEELYLREVSLFPDWFLPQIMEAKKNAGLRAEYMDIWREILGSFPLAREAFVHRDFHADNLIWLPQRQNIKRLGLLDFQDAVLGDSAYDMVSLLEDARRDVSPELAESMISRYLQQTRVDENNFRAAYDILGAQRNSKIIGIFVRLAVRDGKENYLRFLPRVWAHLQRDIKHPLLKNLHDWLAVNVPLEARGEIKLCQKK
ncbi:MAG: phosphotransferase [Rickettsiales bacterium]|jgi:aminoglycoside/choline kinase family phosphotransferase